MRTNIVKVVLIILMFTCCHKKNEPDVKNLIEKSFKVLPHEEQIELIRENTSHDSILSSDYNFITVNLLENRFDIDIAKYQNEKSLPIRLNKEELIEKFEGFQNIGDLDKDGKDDHVFVLDPLDFCEEGQSYYFSNPTIPRIFSESYCCHPNSIFSIGDIDEDGSNEIGQYYSSCASRYKSINIWTLSENVWSKIDQVAFTINDDYQVFADFDKLSEKISKGVFRFLEITDVDENGETISEWKIIKMQ